jgi:hypothetical protein
VEERSKEVLASSPDRFGVFVDVRTLEPLDEDARDVMQDGRAGYRTAGVVGSVLETV